MIELSLNAFGQLVLGGAIEGVYPVRAFPVSAPGTCIALMSPEGKLLEWIPDLAALPENQAGLIADCLRSREFMPEITRLQSVSGFVAPCEWHVGTDRGDTAFTLGSEDDIRRINARTLIVLDRHGVNYLLKLDRLDRHSRKLLARFL